MKTPVEKLRDAVYELAKQSGLKHVDRIRAIHLALAHLDSDTLAVIHTKAA